MPRDLRLLPTQCNAIFRLVRDAGLDPNEFRWDEEEISTAYDDALVSILRHVPTKFFYKFKPEWAVYSPGPTSRTHESKVLGWNSHFSLVDDWLYCVKREYEAPDLWGLLRQDTKLLQLASSPDLPNEAFTELERQSIRDQLAEIRQHLISVHHLQLQQGEIIDQGFSYLGDCLNRVGKKDWLNIAINTVVTIASAAAFSPTVAQDMIHRFMLAVHPLYESIMKLLT